MFHANCDLWLRVTFEPDLPRGEDEVSSHRSVAEPMACHPSSPSHGLPPIIAEPMACHRSSPSQWPATHHDAASIEKLSASQRTNVCSKGLFGHLWPVSSFFSHGPLRGVLDGAAVAISIVVLQMDPEDPRVTGSMEYPSRLFSHPAATCIDRCQRVSRLGNMIDDNCASVSCSHPCHG